MNPIPYIKGKVENMSKVTKRRRQHIDYLLEEGILKLFNINCYFCKEDININDFKGEVGKKLTVHHIMYNENEETVMAHSCCHKSYHLRFMQC